MAQGSAASGGSTEAGSRATALEAGTPRADAAHPAALPDAAHLDAGARAQDGGGSTAASPHDAGPDAAAAASSKRAACRAYINAYCVRYVECMGTNASLYACLGYADQCPDFLFSEGSAHTVAQTLACTAAFSDFDCALLAQGRGPDCIPKGTLPEGHACLYTSQCSTGICYRTGGVACGACRQVAAPGGACSDQTVCRPPAECNSGTCSMPSFSEMSLANRLPGEACTPVTDLCVQQQVCMPDNATAATGHCQERPAPGEPCTIPGAALCFANGSCGADARCDPIYPCTAQQSPCTPPGVCVCADSACQHPSCTLGREEGLACKPPLQGCAPGLECKSGICVATDAITRFAQACP